MVRRVAAADGGTTADHVYQELHEAIMNGDFAPGERLIELQLTERYGVSRTPVREALSRLVEGGIARRLAGGGIVAATEPLESILDTLLIFEVLEGLAARLAVERAGPRSIAKLRQALNSLADAVERKDKQDLLSRTSDFNAQLWQMAECEQLSRMLSMVAWSDQRRRHSTLWREGRATEVLAQMEQLVRAVENHDAVEAEEVARAIVRRSREVRRLVESELESQRGKGRRKT